MSSRQILKVANFKTASRCWIPAAQPASSRYFSSKQRYINFNLHSLSDANLIANDDVLTHEASKHTTTRIQHDKHEEVFEPTVYSSEEVHTAGPVNKEISG
ncbi:hypothetical protein PSN45_000712 [Yamadazyma tenuis]|uniref:Uncharacterized protein n=1 Tax=Candida tenuis (strain ATCC 10573 / BCRC 21748 / CBS 615 / JCM 9827 / NBRC 10315 / NRRL Y-1498 / VKM Y-70) TaxID=590646 RepID=G3BA31_CANTC|nr:uncharacterized protein CANTEDRAFT_115461 [Yamadazyma tenuis ATCC 10573]XP_006688168.1 uncharacterized protein CANTEDRAFT_115461 [Yamadazyma tenuis ATCC 10573]EGV61997.1 hypothetical protein CANTEDRAFT_115461 [Yamadazyma tenuis ATCC 10573]EGV61998.1 hypothetical protein CANTEDRAFT_115461 [Yamadazyma tenuis ATCC 10573]WEJ93250.1 hypothetical protein PSN45_000712 [Yamadazyma tenuis]